MWLLKPFRNQVSEYQSQMEKLQEEKEILEARIEQRHMQVCTCNKEPNSRASTSM